VSNVSSVSVRRDLRFTSFDEVRRDLATLAAAEETGRLIRHGNWTLGQAMGHLATWINFAFDGYPMKRLPWALRWVGPLARRWVLRRGMAPAMRLPGAPSAGTWGTDVLPTGQGHEKLLTAVQRLETTAPLQPNPIFGRLTHDQWRQLHLAHCSLHLSFFRA